jgi:RNase P subunit RPR2
MEETKPQPPNVEVLPQAEKEMLAARLKEKITRWICPMCTNIQWELGDGYFNFFLSKNYKETQIGGVNIPAISIICKNCGHISFHALGTIGLLPKE